MAEAKDAEVKKKGFFSRKKSEPAPATVKPAQPSPKAAAAPKPAPPRIEPRLSLESMPEVERRIDRMHATERRASLLERYENKYGEKLDVPKTFLPVEAEKAQTPAPEKAEPPAAAPTAPKATDARPAAAPGAPKPASPALPPKDVKAPEPKPVAAAPKPAEAAKPVPAAAKPSEAPRPVAPASPPLQLPEGMTLGKYLWPQIWPFWGFPLRRFAKAKWPDKKNMVLVMTIVDLPLLVLLFIPRLLGIFWIGLILWVIKFVKKRKVSAAETAAAATN